MSDQNGVFSEEKITDHKRLVRGEHLLLARTKLRVRDFCHHAPWKVLMLAGGAPGGEIRAIRELMPKAYIVAADYQADQVARASAAGANEGIVCDLSAFEIPSTGHRSHRRPPAPLAHLMPFDLIDMDLCGTVSQTMRDMVRVYHRLALRNGGIMMLTFSYGRDVAEVFLELAKTIEPLAKDMPPSLLGRLAFVKVGPADFELAVVYPDSASLYDCPQERIDSLRRKFAAIKAHATMRANAEGQERAE